MINRKYLYNYKSGGVRGTEPQIMPEMPRPKKPEPNINKNLLRNYNISDIEGLRKAYASPSGAYVHGDRMYVAGTRNAMDVYDDITKVPFNLTKYSDRYKSVKKVLDENPQVKFLSGHSLGGAIALSLNKDNGMRYETRTYNAPVVSFQQAGETGRNYRIRDSSDWVSAFDRGAITVDREKPNPLHAHFLSDFNDIGDKPSNQPIEVEEITKGFKTNIKSDLE